ncbi:MULTISPECIES: biotin synthase BioB [Carboxydocella]|uniref:Biotin synthase n=2 Tax=Carboxydocella TaxID=178898 RepID=A0A1T4S775_9FIRM|nr:MULTISPECIES: biotin synthase BioB [Carboxydocella]AVX20689.1 biotin synthase [Carboxydocella thermautotrophica]AVX31108.1 biotin synthase [Carboxydocella thermautotrophica]SKA24093.1 biotin synthase [Carboxydocella sporoproducens DSM 16521]GAW28219.1 biotin synthase BioB [Carboxydocella sp. ULO1]GAW32826.1 biotin synthase BioB [Carboxydocella sp. JDF658]
MFNRIIELAKKVLDGQEISFEEAMELARAEGADIQVLAAMAAKIREKFAGDKVDLCSIISVKTGRCSEDCAFCAQSAHHHTNITPVEMLNEEEIIAKAKAMEAAGAHHFDLVTAGLGMDENDPLFLKILDIYRRLRQEISLQLCACLGTLSEKAAQMLREAGVTRYNHNLETARSFFPQIVTTHTYEERIATIKNVKKAGMEVCCGGIIGMGESMAQRIEFAFTLKELDVDAIPINVLNPIKGTKLEGRPLMSPLEVIKTFAIFRFILPTKNIRYAGGREVNLRDMQALGLMAGLNGMLIGHYLTTQGREVETDLQMIKDLGLKI